MLDWVAGVTVERHGTSADHKPDRLQLRSPSDPVRICRPARVYPPPATAATAVRQSMTDQLEHALLLLNSDQHADVDWALWWDDLKRTIRVDTLKITKQKRQAARWTHKQRLRRLLRRENRLLEEAAGTAATVDTITDHLDVLTLRDGRGGTPLARARNAVADCLKDTAAQKRQQLFRAGGHQPGKTTKGFFKRVSTKYADNDINRLDAVNDCPDRAVHDKADSLADAWLPIFQQEQSTAGASPKVLDWLGPAGQHTHLLADLAEPFTEAEVAAAIGSSKPGKACGSDRFGNDWYRDFAALLIPLLTVLFNKWYTSGIFPASFLQADIFCLQKGTASANPLNYRPLALLNTDYKLVTRILATRASQKLASVIHPNQNGFVPHRNIHDTIDLFTTARTAAQTDPRMAEALAILLDFVKAYDSVDRRFLYAVIEWMGFPPTFLAAMKGLHEGT